MTGFRHVHSSALTVAAPSRNRTGFTILRRSLYDRGGTETIMKLSKLYSG